MMPKRPFLPLLLAAMLSLGAVACSPTDNDQGTAEDGSSQTIVDPANNGNDPDASGDDTLGSPDATQDDGTTQNEDTSVDSSADPNSSFDDTSDDANGTDTTDTSNAEESESNDDSGSGNVVNEEGGVGNPMTDSIFREPSGNNTADEPVDPQDDLDTDASAPDENDTDTSNTTRGN